MLVNDDVDFYSGIISKMITRLRDNDADIVVGATCDNSGEFSYGAHKLIIPRKRDIYRRVMPSEEAERCDTFNCNCVLVDDEVIRILGNFDPVYRHTLADIDYGLYASRNGYTIISTSSYIGVCNHNSQKGTWSDTSLSRIERLRKKESPKGAPLKEWFHFMYKNFGLKDAIIYSVSPYVRILFGTYVI